MKKFLVIILFLITPVFLFSAAPQAAEPEPAGEVYIVKKGDVISRLAKRFNVSTQSLLRANGIGKDHVLHIGQKLIIPQPEQDGIKKVKAPVDDPSPNIYKPIPTKKKKQAGRTITLEQAIERALLANRPLLTSRDNVEGAKLSVDIAESEFDLKILPEAGMGMNVDSKNADQREYQAGVEFNKKFSTGGQIGVAPGVVKTDKSWESRVAASFTQPLIRGVSSEYNLSAVHGAEYQHRSARRRHHLDKVNTILRTVDAVYDVINYRELLRLYSESAERLRGYSYAARIKEKVGLTMAIDVFRSEIQLNQTQDALLAAQEAYLAALDGLKLLLALPIEENIEVEAPINYNLFGLSLETACRTALANRVAIREAEDAKRESERLVRVAKHNILPELNLVLNYSQFGLADDFSRSSRLDEHALSVSLTAGTDIARTAEKAQYKQSRLQLDAARRNIPAVRDEVIRQVKSEYRKLNRTEHRIMLQQKQIKQARAKLLLSQIRFRWGQAGNFDLIESEIELRRAQTNLLSAELDYIISTYYIRAAMGTLLDSPKI